MNKKAVYISLIIGAVVVLITLCMVCQTHHTPVGEVVDTSTSSYEYKDLEQSYSSDLFDVYTQTSTSELEEVTTRYLKHVEACNSKLLYCDYLDLVGDVFGMVVMDGCDCEVVVISQVDGECEVKVVRFNKDGFKQW